MSQTPHHSRIEGLGWLGPTCQSRLRKMGMLSRDAHARVRSKIEQRMGARLPPSTLLLVRELRFELVFALRHRRAVRRTRSLAHAGLRLDFGSGAERVRSGWHSVDLMNPNADLQLDLRRPLPFRDGAVAEIHSEHFFEHLEYLEGRRLLRECLRVLEPGGRLSLGVPDPEPLLRAYLDRDLGWFGAPASWAATTTGWHEPEWTPMQHLNFLFHQGRDHRFIYDFETLSRSMEDAGFVDIKRRSFDPTRDTEFRRGNTLYIDANRPLGEQHHALDVDIGGQLGLRHGERHRSQVK
jgi:SAM-dependent methyltransferase